MQVIFPSNCRPLNQQCVTSLVPSQLRSLEKTTHRRAVVVKSSQARHASDFEAEPHPALIAVLAQISYLHSSF